MCISIDYTYTCTCIDWFDYWRLFNIFFMEKKVWDKTLYINESCQKQLCTILSMFAIKNPLWFKKKICFFLQTFFYIYDIWPYWQKCILVIYYFSMMYIHYNMRIVLKYISWWSSWPLSWSLIFINIHYPLIFFIDIIIEYVSVLTVVMCIAIITLYPFDGRRI